MNAPILLGRIIGAHGVRGGVKIYSYCRPRETIFKYKKLICKQKNNAEQTLTLKTQQSNDKNLIAYFEGINDRDQALALQNSELYIERAQLPPLQKGQHYWADLIGCAVYNRQAQYIGEVKDIFETGAHDILVIQKERQEILIPWVEGHYIDRIDSKEKRIDVDWESAWADDEN